MIRTKQAVVHSFPRSPPPTTAQPSEPRRDATAPTSSWSSSGRASLPAALRERLNSQAGRELFAELFENQVNSPDASQGYVWDPSNQRPMEWTFRSTELADDALVVTIAGRAVTITSEASGFEGQARLDGTTREDLTRGISAALKTLDEKVAAERSP